MKKIIKKNAMALVALFIASVTLMSFERSANLEVSSDPPHWFDAETGRYLGKQLKSAIQLDCGNPGSTVCAEAYETIDANENPVGSPIDHTTRQ